MINIKTNYGPTFFQATMIELGCLIRCPFEHINADWATHEFRHFRIQTFRPTLIYTLIVAARTFDYS